jgi:hypothetical protein
MPSHQMPPLFKFPAWKSHQPERLKQQRNRQRLFYKPAPHQYPSLKGWHWALMSMCFYSEGFTLGFDVGGFQPLLQKSIGYFCKTTFLRDHNFSKSQPENLTSLKCWNNKETGSACLKSRPHVRIPAWRAGTNDPQKVSGLQPEYWCPCVFIPRASPSVLMLEAFSLFCKKASAIFVKRHFSETTIFQNLSLKI